VIRQVLTDVGDWSIDLAPDTPRRILAYTDLDTYGFSRLVVTPLHVPTHAIAADDLPTVARYTGILRTVATDRRSNRQPISLGGAGLAILLGDEDGKGDIFENDASVSRVFYDGPSNNSALRSVLDRGNGITDGAIVTANATSRDYDLKAGDTPRKMLDLAMSVYPTKRLWRINPDATLDANTRANLFRTGEVAIIPGGGGRDGDLYGIDPITFAHDRDVEDLSTRIRVNASGVTNTGEADIVSNPYTNPAGDPLEMTRFVTSQQAGSAAAAGNIAETQLARFDEVRRQLRITTSHYDLAKHVEPGDSIYVYDPDQGLVDTTTQVHYRGEVIFPRSIRVEALRWPVQTGMGVYLLVGDPAEAIDLTPYVLMEDGATSEIEVGAFSRTLQSTTA